MSALRTVKWHFMTFTLLVPSGLAAGPRTSWAPESHTQSWKITFPGKGGITLPWLKYELFWLNPGTDNKMVKGILCSYTKYGRVSTWLLRPPHHHHHRHPIPFTWPQTHCASPLTELLNWLAVKNKSIPLLSSSQFFFFSPCFFPFFPLTSLTRTLCRLSPALGVWVFFSVRGKTTGRNCTRCNSTNQYVS